MVNKIKSLLLIFSILFINQSILPCKIVWKQADVSYPYLFLEEINGDHSCLLLCSLAQIFTDPFLRTLPMPCQKIKVNSRQIFLSNQTGVPADFVKLNLTINGKPTDFKTYSYCPELERKRSNEEIKEEFINTQEEELEEGFSSNTPVLTPHGFKAIKDLCIGDRVISFDSKKGLWTSTLVINTRTLDNKAKKVKIRIGKKLISCSQNQCFYLPIDEKWVHAKDLKLNDKLLYKVDNRGSVFGLTEVDEVLIDTDNKNSVEPSIIITLAKHQNFCVNAGILVHNSEFVVHKGELFNIFQNPNALGLSDGKLTLKEKESFDVRGNKVVERSIYYISNNTHVPAGTESNIYYTKKTTDQDLYDGIEIPLNCCPPRYRYQITREANSNLTSNENNQTFQEGKSIQQTNERLRQEFRDRMFALGVFEACRIKQKLEYAIKIWSHHTAFIEDLRTRKYKLFKEWKKEQHSIAVKTFQDLLKEAQKRAPECDLKSREQAMLNKLESFEEDEDSQTRQLLPQTPVKELERLQEALKKRVDTSIINQKNIPQETIKHLTKTFEKHSQPFSKALASGWQNKAIQAALELVLGQAIDVPGIEIGEILDHCKNLMDKALENFKTQKEAPKSRLTKQEALKEVCKSTGLSESAFVGLVEATQAVWVQSGGSVAIGNTGLFDGCTGTVAQCVTKAVIVAAVLTACSTQTGQAIIAKASTLIENLMQKIRDVYKSIMDYFNPTPESEISYCERALKGMNSQITTSSLKTADQTKACKMATSIVQPISKDYGKGCHLPIGQQIGPKFLSTPI